MAIEQNETAWMPSYERVKRYIVEQIRVGNWKPDDQLPSEAKLCELFQVSRMTAARALRELAYDGWLVRMQGVGTFVASARPTASLLEVKDIAQEIRQLNRKHSARVLTLEAINAPAIVASELEMPPDSRIFHSEVVHYEDGQPIQYEERYVNPSAAPHYLEQDYTSITPNEYLTTCDPAREVEQTVEAILPDEKFCDLLQVAPNEPCLLLHRRTWTDVVATSSRFVYAGQRCRLGSRYPLNTQGNPQARSSYLFY